MTLHGITFVDTLLQYEQPLVVTARDAAGRAFVGLSYGEGDAEGRENFALVQVGAADMFAFVQGQVDLQVLLTAQSSGLLLTVTSYGTPGESAHACVVDALPSAAMPRAGMFMPAQPSTIISAVAAAHGDALPL